MKNDYPFHIDYARALTSGDIPALRKLIRRALRAKPQKEFFTGDKNRGALTPYEELITAVWRTFEAGHVEHGRLFLAAGLPVDILMRDVDGVAPRVPWTPLDVTIMPLDGDDKGKLQLLRMLLAAGANPKRDIWDDGGPLTTVASYVQSLEAAQIFREYGVPAEAFVSLPPHLRARLQGGLVLR